MEGFVDNIYDLTIQDFNKFQEAILVVQNVGSDLSDIPQHIQKINTFIDADRKEDAKNEVVNYYMLLASAPKAQAKIEALRVICKDESIFDKCSVKELYDEYDRLKKKFLTN